MRTQILTLTWYVVTVLDQPAQLLEIGYGGFVGAGVRCSLVSLCFLTQPLVILHVVKSRHSVKQVVEWPEWPARTPDPQIDATDALQTVAFVCGLCEGVHFAILVYRMAMR